MVAEIRDIQRLQTLPTFAWRELEKLFWTKTVPLLIASEKMGINKNTRNWIQLMTKMNLKENSSLEPPKPHVALPTPWFLPWESLYGCQVEPCYTWSLDMHKAWDNKFVLFSSTKFVVIYNANRKLDNYEIKEEDVVKMMNPISVAGKDSKYQDGIHWPQKQFIGFQFR